MCCLLCLTWPSQMALHQQAHCPQMVLELRCLCVHLLPQVHLSHSALDWNWWVINSSYAGSSCTLPHLGVYQLDWYIRIGLLFNYIYPIFPSVVFYDNLWRQLQRLGPCPQPPRPLPCFFYCNFVYGIVPPWLGMFQPFYEPISCVLTFSAWILRWQVP